ncbi:MAG: tetratricopeptide repeat protein [Candidatus Nitronauta litoralis]|uniref:Tetratricopeptide repeat protein n=1 Tax=Candidatus Nitronauta litoralis TaxID=2705533 RepID=A0A7T0BW23_9BACT|nr:MAG: tetratricopeptide repeat protein [Candidatus Nitronauta litoralis]
MNCPKCGFESPPGFKFCGGCGHNFAEAGPASAEPTAAPAPAPPSPPPPVPVQTESKPPLVRNERRDVTVLFADVSGFTAMSEKLDPEEVHSIMNLVFEGLGLSIREEDGYIDKYIGDNVMALFGAPVAHEDDPQRACRAALGMQAFLAEFSEQHQARTGVNLRMRIGIHCGLVLAGEIGAEFRKDYSVMGDTVNLASRMESNAPPGSVQVSGEVARRVRSQFQFGPVQFIKVKGKEHPVEARILEKEITERDAIDRDPISAPLIGREKELQNLIDLLNAGERDPEWIEVTGEAGVGKTRLVEEAMRHLPRHQQVPLSATPNSQRQPFGLVQLMVRALVHKVLRIHIPTTEREQLEALEPTLGIDMATFGDALWYLYAPRRLSVPPPDRDPQTLRRILEQSITALLERFGRQYPNIILVLHSWEIADEASVKFFTSLAEKTGHWPLPIVATTREPSMGPHRKTLELMPFSDEVAHTLLDRLVRGAELSEALRSNLVTRASGVPQFLEELVRALVTEEIIQTHDDGTWYCCPDATAAVLPSSLFNAQVSRLDRLEAPERNLLQQFSVQGYEFNLNIAEKVREQPKWQGPPLPSLLPQLEGKSMVQDVSGLDVSVPRWTFNHPLLCEASYETMLIKDRKELHGQIGESLLDAAGGDLNIASELLAHHYERAEQWEGAAQANLSAGDRAAAMFLNEEALTRYNRAQEMISKVETWREKGLHIKVLALGSSAEILLRLGRYAEAEEMAQGMHRIARRSHDKAEANRLHAAVSLKLGKADVALALLSQALEASMQDDRSPKTQMNVLYDLGELHYLQSNMEKALEYLGRYRTMIPPTDTVPSIRADLFEGKIHHAQGRFQQAVALYSQAYASARQTSSLSDLANASNQMGNARRDEGHYSEAQRHFESALQIWNRIGMTEFVAGAHINLGNLGMSLGDFKLTREHHQKALTAFQEIGNVRGVTLAQINLAVAAIELEEGTDAVHWAQEAINNLGSTGNALLLGQSLVILGESYLACDDFNCAREVFDRVIEEFKEDNHPLAHAGACRGLGRVHMMQQGGEEARAFLLKALERYEHLKREQEAARTLLHLAHALWKEGENEQAQEKIRQARERFRTLGARVDVERAETLMREFGV